jgi:polyferredoxin
MLSGGLQNSVGVNKLVMLRFIKSVHTFIWVIMTTSNFLAFYFAFIGRFDAWFWIPCLLIVSEIFIILFNNWRCPITPIAEKYTEDRKSNFDIYLPEWLAKNNVKIFSGIIVVELLILVVKYLL